LRLIKVIVLTVVDASVWNAGAAQLPPLSAPLDIEYLTHFGQQPARTAAHAAVGLMAGWVP